MAKAKALYEHTDKDEIEMMSNPSRWPQWPWLPMKRRLGHGWPDIGVLHADAEPNKPTKIYKGNLFDGKLSWFPKPDQEFWKEYPNFDAIIADGWVVD